MLKELIEKSKDPHLLMIVEDFTGWEDVAVFWEELKMDAEYIGCFDRTAVIGDKKWKQWGTQFVNPITKDELKFSLTDKK